MVCFQSNTCAQETQRQKQEHNQQQSQYRDQSDSLQQEQQQHDLKTYRGQVSAKHDNYYFQEAYSRASYLLEDTWEAKKFLNKKVRITGWVDADKSILHVVTMTQVP